MGDDIIQPEISYTCKTSCEFLTIPKQNYKEIMQIANIFLKEKLVLENELKVNPIVILNLKLKIF